MKTLRIGMAGLDTSHVPVFANLLHETSQPYHVPGARIVTAFPSGSPDFDLSINRVDAFSAEMIEVIRFLESGNLSVLTGEPVSL